MANKNILLIEPRYKNKYPPLGLMKIAQYHGQEGKSDNVTFIKGEDKSVLSQAWDRIYVTTLFSFEWPKMRIPTKPATQSTPNRPPSPMQNGHPHEDGTMQGKWS